MAFSLFQYTSWRHEEAVMSINSAAGRQARNGKERIARQTALVEELQEQGHKALATVARGILTSLEKSQDLMEGHLRKTRSAKTKKHRRARTH